MTEKMPCSITDGRQYDDGMFELCDICDGELGKNGRCFECDLEAGDHLLDQRKEDSLSNALVDITRSLKP